ncbi:MAG TPA: hypothetical protein VHD90_27365 [Phototrophicaceae bacterium]|nr:hypothetical protein [Phototrophicaceae bacterium]
MAANVEAMVREGINAYKTGNKDEARVLLLKATELDQYNEQAWLWLSGLMETPDDQRTCLENVLAINPNNERAKQGLSYLTGQTSAGNVSPFAAGSAPPSSAPPSSIPSSVEWASNDAPPSTPSSNRPLPQEPAGSALDDWVTNLNLPVNDAQSGMAAATSTSPFGDFDFNDDDAFTGGNPFSSPIEDAPAQASAASARRNQMSPTPTEEPPRRREARRRKDESLLTDLDDDQDGRIEAGESQMFGDIPAEIPATRLPGTRQRTPVLLSFGILVLIVLNLVVAFVIMWGILT